MRGNDVGAANVIDDKNPVLKNMFPIIFYYYAAF